jgi:glycosyltransferase involved in cell wall biosynthesis
LIKINRFIKVANIIEEGRIGGPQKRIAMVAHKISKKIETTVIMPSKNSGDFQSLCKRYNIKFLTLPLTTPSKNIISILSYLVTFPYEVVRLSSLLKKNHYDLIHVSGGSWQFKGIIAAWLANMNSVWHINDVNTPIIIRILLKLLSPLTTGYIFSAYRAKKYYHKYLNLKKPNFIIPPPVDTFLFNPAKNFYKNKKIINIKKKLIIIGTVGNINEIKGFETFIKAASILNKNFKNLSFLVVGKVYSTQNIYFNNLKLFCKKMKVSNIHFVNNCRDIRPFLQRFDIFTITSLSETGPMTLWEAMSMQKAVVSTDVGDVKKYIKNNLNGFIVDIEDSNALAKKISKLVISPKLRKDFGIKARLVVKNKLDLRLCANLHAAAYHSITNKS